MLNCKVCEKEQKNQSSLYNHYNYHIKKEKCEVQKEKIRILMNKQKLKKNIFKCDICEVNFASRFSLTRHKQTCTKVLEDCFSAKLEELKKILANSLSNDHEALDKSTNLCDDISKMFNLSSIPNNINNNIENNMGNIINGNVNITNNEIKGNNTNINNLFGGVRNINDQSMDKYNEPLKDIKKIQSLFRNSDLNQNVDKMFLSLDKFFNCNRDYPENHNIVVTNHKKHKPCLVKENDEWIHKQGEDMKKVFYDRIAECNVLYQDFIPEKLKEIYPEKSDGIDKMSDTICDIYSFETDQIKERLWSKFFEQTYLHKHLLLNSYKRDLVFQEELLQKQKTIDNIDSMLK